MNDPTRPDDDLPAASADDELVSAVLDGEATPDERARVEADPVLRERLSAFTRLQDANTALDVPPAALGRSLVAAALDASATPDDERDEPVVAVDLDARRRSRRRMATALAVAAAVIVVVPLLAVTIFSVGTDTGYDAATSSDDAASEAAADQGGSADEATDRLAAGTPPDAAATEAPAVDLGLVLDELVAVDSLAELRASVLQALAANRAPDAFAESGQRAVPTTASADGSARQLASEGASCAAALVAADPALGTIEWAGVTTLAGQPVVVFVFDADDGVLVVTRPDCTVVDRQPL